MSFPFWLFACILHTFLRVYKLKSSFEFLFAALIKNLYHDKISAIYKKLKHWQWKRQEEKQEREQKREQELGRWCQETYWICPRYWKWRTIEYDYYLLNVFNCTSAIAIKYGKKGIVQYIFKKEKKQVGFKYPPSSYPLIPEISALTTMPYCRC